MLGKILLAATRVAVALSTAGRAPAPIPVRHGNLTRHRIGVLLRTLLEEGQASSFLVIEVPPTDLFVQFALSGQDGGPLRIVAAFPKAPWSVPYLEGARARMQRTAAVLWTEPGEGAVESFLHGDFGSDTDRASEFAFRTLEEVFGVDPVRQAVAVIEHP